MRSVKITAFLYLFTAFISCRNDNTSEVANELNPKDSCLYKSIVKGAKQLNLNITEFHVEEEYDSTEVLSSLRKFYYDTVMTAFSQSTKVSIDGDSIGKIVLSEYLLDSNYYRVIKAKVGGLWAATKVEGPFSFRNDSGEVYYPGVFIIKGTPNVLIARSSDTSFSEYERRFLLNLIPLINDCRGTNHW